MARVLYAHAMDFSSLGRALGDAAVRVGKAALQGAATGARRSASASRTARRRSHTGSRSSNSHRVTRPSRRANGRDTTATVRSGPDFTGRPPTSYSPTPDGIADPGEVVWAWVPYEEDHTQGKDRPALVIGRDDDWLLALQVTSQDHDRDAQQEARAGRYWMDIGTGGWDPQRRPSEVRLDRIVRLAPDAVRREGAPLDRGLFEQVLREVDRYAGR